MRIRDYSLLLIPESGPSTQDDEHLALIDQWVIGSIQDICNEWEWDCLKTSETITAVALQAEYTLQATASSILMITIPDEDRQIYERSETWLKENTFNLEQESDTTQYYYPSGYDESTKQNKIKFYPVPSTSTNIYEVSQKKRIDDLESDSECPLPIEFKELIMAGARIRIMQHNKNYQMVSYWDTKFLQKMSQLKNAGSDNPGKGLRKEVSDLTDSYPMGPRLDPTHYRNER